MQVYIAIFFYFIEVGFPRACYFYSFHTNTTEFGCIQDYQVPGRVRSKIAALTLSLALLYVLIKHEVNVPGQF